MSTTAVIRGKRYALKDDFMGRAGWADLMAIVRALPTTEEERADYDRITGVMTRMVESWEWPGDPTDAEDWTKHVPSIDTFLLYAEANRVLSDQQKN